MSTLPNLLPKISCFVFPICLLISCAGNEPDAYSAIPNYDQLLGRKYSDVIYLGRAGAQTIHEDTEFETLEKKRADGCATAFTVRKKDDVIVAWAITPSPALCRVARWNIGR